MRHDRARRSHAEFLRVALEGGEAPARAAVATATACTTFSRLSVALAALAPPA